MRDGRRFRRLEHRLDESDEVRRLHRSRIDADKWLKRVRAAQSDPSNAPAPRFVHWPCSYFAYGTMDPCDWTVPTKIGVGLMTGDGD